METNIVTYNIEVIKESFDANHKKTAVVQTFIANKLVSEKKYGIVTKEEIYIHLKNNEDVNLNGCYVKDFSISEFKKGINLPASQLFDINNFEAENAFFDCSFLTDFSGINFKGKAKFSNTIFSHGNLSFFQSRFTSNEDVEFIDTIFGNGEINFQYVEFGKLNRVLFTSSNFHGGVVSFVNANFNDGDALFNSVNFNNCKVKFNYSKFGKGGINFQKTKFGDRSLDFRKVEFGTGRVDFRRAVFGNGYITFDEAEMVSGKFNFRLTRFGNNDISFHSMNFGDAEVLFENVNFGTGQVSFSECIAKSISFKGSRLDVFLDLTVKQVKEIDLSDTVLRDIIDLKPANNHHVHLNTLYLYGMRNLGRIIIDWRENNIKNLIKNQQNTTLRQKAEQFNILKENFHLGGQYEDEDMAYIQFKRFELRADYEKTLKGGGLKLLKMPNYLFRWLIFDKMGLYATSPMRVLLSVLVVYVLYSWLYLLLHFFNIGDVVNAVGATDQLTYLQTCFYHSAITFLTVGYGDYYPMGYSRGISIMEGWSGVFLMSYFTVAFVRKILR
ncbi:MAG: hypothetical protein COX70_02320 [Flavobacteriales bacterium CG_4_10_14_0_2_um_filter_32_8]|nr:MAG: hypothetical protein COX70_02320 [Flavobacteriales bacterium CG_4_10_14_0_2_um_filter_32_8]PJB15002.1 MAG: hypothetical protein CO118_05610 [Flavobacteriales bacterium CG_4_9_14_3_um_filter_32_8]